MICADDKAGKQNACYIFGFRREPGTPALVKTQNYALSLFATVKVLSSVLGSNTHSSMLQRLLRTKNICSTKYAWHDCEGETTCRLALSSPCISRLFHSHRNPDLPQRVVQHKQFSLSHAMGFESLERSV